jgi:XRE family aerobic/anaerobic benzoate catabolism transcriptional regulator
MSDTADPAAELLCMVGRRVRVLRQAQGLSRRALSERSGVSQRYIAQLEAGEGNASLVVLTRVTAALGETVAQLLREDSEASDMAALYRAAPAATQAHVRTLLGAGPKTAGLCLIGLRGAGKSTLGLALAEDLALPFVELSREVEAAAGVALPEVIALYGPEGLRRLEAHALGQVIGRGKRVVLAVAGGIVSAPATFAQLRAAFHLIWLRASPEEHMARVRAQGDTRPMAGNPAALAELKESLRDRGPLYAQADAVLDTSGQDVAESLQDLKLLVRNRILTRRGSGVGAS